MHVRALFAQIYRNALIHLKIIKLFNILSVILLIFII